MLSGRAWAWCSPGIAGRDIGRPARRKVSTRSTQRRKRWRCSARRARRSTIFRCSVTQVRRGIRGNRERRSEERRVGKSGSVRVDPGGGGHIRKKIIEKNTKKKTN